MFNSPAIEFINQAKRSDLDAEEQRLKAEARARKALRAQADASKLNASELVARLVGVPVDAPQEQSDAEQPKRTRARIRTSFPPPPTEPPADATG